MITDTAFWSCVNDSVDATNLIVMVLPSHRYNSKIFGEGEEENIYGNETNWMASVSYTLHSQNCLQCCKWSLMEIGQHWYLSQYDV